MDLIKNNDEEEIDEVKKKFYYDYTSNYTSNYIVNQKQVKAEEFYITEVEQFHGTQEEYNHINEEEKSPEFIEKQYDKFRLTTERKILDFVNRINNGNREVFLDIDLQPYWSDQVFIHYIRSKKPEIKETVEDICERYLNLEDSTHYKDKLRIIIVIRKRKLKIVIQKSRKYKYTNTNISYNTRDYNFYNNYAGYA